MPELTKGTNILKVVTPPVSAVAASGVITLTANPANLDTVTINGTTYTFKTALASANDVLIGVANTNTAANLQAAIVAGAGAGTTYGTGTVAHTTVNASVTTNAVTVTAKVKGTINNVYTLTKSGANVTISGATFTGGVDGTLAGSAGLWQEDGSFIYGTTDVNGIADANWFKVAITAI